MGGILLAFIHTLSPRHQVRQRHSGGFVALELAFAVAVAAETASVESGGRVINAREAVGHGHGEVAVTVSGEGVARQELGDGCAGAVTRGEGESGGPAAGAKVGENGDHVAFAHGDGVGVGVDGVVLVGQIRAVLGDGVFPGGVERGDEFVEHRAGVVAGQPDGFAVEGHAAATFGLEVLFLAFVDDGNPVGEHGEGDDIFGSCDIGIQLAETGLVLVLAESSE